MCSASVSRQIELLLARAGFVVGAADADAHRLQRGQHVVAGAGDGVLADAEVTRRHRAVGSDVRIVAEQVILHLDPDPVVETQLSGVGEPACQHRAGIAGERLAVAAQHGTAEAGPAVRRRRVSG